MEANDRNIRMEPAANADDAAAAAQVLPRIHNALPAKYGNRFTLTRDGLMVPNRYTGGQRDLFRTAPQGSVHYNVQDNDAGDKGTFTQYTPDAEGTERHIRIGAMMTEAHISHAFDFYQQGMKFPMQSCTIPPYDRLNECVLEVTWACAAIAAQGMDANLTDLGSVMWTLAGNAFAVGLPDTMFYPEQEANAMILDGAKRTLSRFTAETHGWINRCYDNPAWNREGAYETLTAAGVLPVVNAYAANISEISRNAMMNTYVSVFIAYAKQGHITQRKMDDIKRQLQESQIIISATPDQISDLWVKFGPYFDDNAARIFFPRWENIMMHRNMRMRLTLQQVANAGLTGLTLIRDMIVECSTFRWDTVAGKWPEEWQNFIAAHQLVGDNIYYGFKTNLGRVGIRYYKTIVHIAKELRKKILGDNNMDGLMTGRNMTTVDAPYANTMVEDYMRWRSHQVAEGNMQSAAAFFGDAQPPANFATATAAPNRMDRLEEILQGLVGRAPPPAPVPNPFGVQNLL